MTMEISIQDHIRSLEEQLLHPQVRKSASSLAVLLDDSFVEFTSSGRAVAKAEIIAALSREPAVSWAISEFETRQLSRNVVLATYRATKYGTESKLPVRSLRSSLWVRAEGQWRLAFHQGTLAAGETPSRSTS